MLTPGLPNIEGTVGGFIAYENVQNGCLTFYDESKPGAGPTYQGVKRVIQFNASLSNPIYGSSGTVQPPSLQMIPQIKF